MEAEAPVLWPPNVKSRFIGKDPDAGQEKGWQKTRWLDSIAASVDMNVSKPRERVRDRGAWHAVVHGVAKSWT